MKNEKLRLELFSDAVIAIIITIMVLEIPLPSEFNAYAIIGLLEDILIYFISFIVVGAFWRQHYYLFAHVDKVDNKLVLNNFLFLFLISLIPFFTRSVLHNPNNIIPIIGYDIIYLFTSFVYAKMFISTMHNSENKNIKKLREKMIKTRQEISPKSVYFRLLFAITIISIVIVFSVLIPKISTIFLFGLPVLFSIINIIFERPSPHGEEKFEIEQNPN